MENQRNKQVSQSIITLMAELRKLSSQISNLLSSADGMFMEKGWNPVDNAAVGSESQSLSHPKRWFTDFFYRAYNHNDYPNYQMFLCVNIDNQDTGVYSTQTRPLIPAKAGHPFRPKPATFLAKYQ